MVVRAMILILSRYSMCLFHRLILILSLLLTLRCSQRGDQVDYKELQVNEVCVLREDNEPVGKIISFCVIDDERFAVSTAEGRIVVFDCSGNQLLNIARRGRGPFEYVEPSIIRATKDNRLIVWCAYMTKFLVYSLLDGRPLFEQCYPLSIRDYIPLEGNLICAYSGNENAGIVIKYDLSSGETLDSGGDWSVSHSLMMMMNGRCPMSVWRGNLYYMPVSELNIYELGENQDDLVARIPSGSFRIDNTVSSSLIDDADKRVEYVLRNPRVLLLDVSDEDYFVVTLEKKGNESSTNKKRHNVAYRYDRSNNKLSGSACFPASSPGLIDLYEHCIYYIIEKLDKTTNTFQYIMVKVIPN